MYAVIITVVLIPLILITFMNDGNGHIVDKSKHVAVCTYEASVFVVSSRKKKIALLYTVTWYLYTSTGNLRIYSYCIIYSTGTNIFYHKYQVNEKRPRKNHT